MYDTIENNPSAEVQLVYFTAPADWVMVLMINVVRNETGALSSNPG